MRTFLFLLLVGCAHDKPHQIWPEPPQPPEEQKKLGACESCRHEFEMCRKRINRPGMVEGSTSGPVGAECMDQFMKCLDAQQLDSTRCAGVN